MKFLVVLLALTAAAFASDVLDLTTDNFDSTLKNSDLALVEFFAPWCGHCKSLAPEYEKAATELLQNDPPVTLAKVDATIESSLGSRFGVSGYPTLKIFRKGVESGPYEGPRTASGIVKYMQKQAGPSSKELTSVAEADKFFETADHAVVGIFSSKDAPLVSALQQFADQSRDDFRFAHTFSADVAAHLKQGDNVVVYFQPKRLNNKLEKATSVYSGKANWKSIKDFVTDASVGLVGHMTPDSEKLFKKPLLVTFFDCDFVRNPSGAKFVRNRLLKLAQELSSDLQFAVANTADFGQYQQSLGLKTGETSVVVLTEKAKYKMDKMDKFNADTVKAFIGEYAAGKLEEYIKSEPLPASNSEPVKVVVGRNFQQIVEDESKDVFIEFYAPWCGHCKTLAPKWDELATKLAKDDSVVIAKMDATANDPPSHFEVRGYPTLYWVPANAKKSPKKYEGAREVQDLLAFVKKNRSSKTKVEL